MDQGEFHELADETIERVKPRIDGKWVRGIELEVAGGEYALAIEDVIDILAEDGVPVTPTERDSLRRLADHMKQRDELLILVDRLNVAEEDASQ